MPITFRVDPARRFVEVRFTGDVSIDDISSYQRELSTTPGYLPSFDSLIDLRGVTSLLGTNELRSLGREARSRTDEQRRRTALVTAEDVVFGVLRQFEAYAEGSPTVFQTFRTVVEALVWLGIEPGALRHVVPEVQLPDDVRGEERPARDELRPPRRNSGEAAESS